MTTEQPSITCPQCQTISYSPNDIAQGYCGHCHEWTSVPPRVQAAIKRRESRQLLEDSSLGQCDPAVGYHANPHKGCILREAEEGKNG